MRVVGLNFCQLLLSFVVWVGISTGGSTAEENLDKALAKSISKMTNTKVFGIFWQNICQISADNLPKFFQKSAKNVPESREIGIRIYV